MPLFSQQSSADGVGLYCLTMSWTFNQIRAANGSQCGEEQCREGELGLKAKDSTGAGFQDCCAQSAWKTIPCQSGADERSEERKEVRSNRLKPLRPRHWRWHKAQKETRQSATTRLYSNSPGRLFLPRPPTLPVLLLPPHCSPPSPSFLGKHSTVHTSEFKESLISATPPTMAASASCKAKIEKKEEDKEQNPPDVSNQAVCLPSWGGSSLDTSRGAGL